MRLILTRHGETEWNLQGRIQGWNDSPLTPNGIRQADRLRERLALIELDGAYASPSGRAVHTARILTEGRAFSFATDERLREIALGAFEGMTFPQLDRLYPEQSIHFREKPELLSPPGGETHAMVRARCEDFLNEVKEHEGTYLVVTHAMTLRGMYLAMLDRPVSDILRSPRTLGCCYCEAEYTLGAWNVVSFGETWHSSPEFGRGKWYHGSPEVLTELAVGSTITPFADLARAFSQKPTRLEISDNGAIAHNGVASGLLYRVEGVDQTAIVQHPRSAMCRAAEWITSLPLALTPIPFRSADGEAMRATDPLP